MDKKQIVEPNKEQQESVKTNGSSRKQVISEKKKNGVSEEQVIPDQKINESSGEQIKLNGSGREEIKINESSREQIKTNESSQEEVFILPLESKILLPILTKQQIQDRDAREKTIAEIERELEEFKFRQMGETKGYEAKFKSFVNQLFTAHDRGRILLLPTNSKWFWTYLQSIANEKKHTIEFMCDSLKRGANEEGELLLDINCVKLSRFLREPYLISKSPRDKILTCMNLEIDISTRTKDKKTFTFSIDTSTAKYDLEFVHREIKAKSQDLTDDMHAYILAIISKDEDLTTMLIGNQRRFGVTGKITIPALGFWFI